MTIMTTMDDAFEVSAATAKARFAECVRTAEQGGTVVITKHGRRVAALVPAAELDHLRRLRVAGPAAGLAGLAGGWKGSDTLASNLRRFPRTSPRRTPRLD